MSLEILKYISPAVIIGTIWAAFHFYQKRKFENSDRKRTEVNKLFSDLNSILNSIESTILNIISELERSVILLKEHSEKLSAYSESQGETITLAEESISKLKNVLQIEMDCDSLSEILADPKKHEEKLEVITENIIKQLKINPDMVKDLFKSLKESERSIDKLPKKVSEDRINSQSKVVSKILSECEKRLKTDIDSLDNLSITPPLAIKFQLSKLSELKIILKKIILTINSDSIFDERNLYSGAINDQLIKVLDIIIEIRTPFLKNVSGN